MLYLRAELEGIGGNNDCWTGIVLFALRSRFKIFFSSFTLGYHFQHSTFNIHSIDYIMRINVATLVDSRYFVAEGHSLSRWIMRYCDVLCTYLMQNSCTCGFRCASHDHPSKVILDCKWCVLIIVLSGIKASGQL